MRHGRHPVLMVNRLPDHSYRQLLAAIDLTEGSARALRAGAALGLLRDASLAALHAFRSPGRSGPILGDASQEVIESHHLAAAEDARAALERFLAGLGLDHASRPQLLVEEGRAATAIRHAVERLRPDLVLLGTGERGALRRILLSSVAEEVISDLECDVLAVPPGRSR